MGVYKTPNNLPYFPFLSKKVCNMNSLFLFSSISSCNLAFAAAKARLQELIEENKNNEFMLQTFFDKKGKYGRLLGVLYTPIEGSEKMFGLTDFSHSLAYDWCPETEYLKYSYNGKLVEEGHAVEYKGKT